MAVSRRFHALALHDVSGRLTLRMGERFTAAIDAMADQLRPA